jgi:hypothetical protein
MVKKTKKKTKKKRVAPAVRRSGSYYGYVEDPIRRVLRVFCTESPPAFVKGYDYSNLDDDQHARLQEWVGCHLNPIISWSTAIGVIEAAQTIVEEAIANANIPPKGGT